MKTTVDIQDELLARAKQHARQTGSQLWEAVDGGLRLVLASPPQAEYKLPDPSVGDSRRPDPLERYSWSDLRSIIYGESEPR